MNKKNRKLLLKLSVPVASALVGTSLSISCSNKASREAFKQYQEVVNSILNVGKTNELISLLPANSQKVYIVDNYYANDYFNVKNAYEKINTLDIKTISFLNNELNTNLENAKKIIQDKETTPNDEVSKAKENLSLLISVLRQWENIDGNKFAYRTTNSNISEVISEFRQYFTYNIAESNNESLINYSINKLHMLMDFHSELGNEYVRFYNFDDNKFEKDKFREYLKAEFDKLTEESYKFKELNPFLYNKELYLLDKLYIYLEMLKNTNIKSGSEQYWNDIEKNLYRLKFIKKLFNNRTEEINSFGVEENKTIIELKNEFKDNIDKAQKFYKYNYLGNYVRYNKLFNSFISFVQYVWDLGPKNSDDTRFLISVFKGWTENFKGALETFKKWSDAINNFEFISDNINFNISLPFPELMKHDDIFQLAKIALYNNQNHRG
ncbi:hypothetical protein [Mycoplasmopsis felifaucium]|uniref:Lipoprotein n=1 Tax=Mycoplasmopsis felifaucium TaxID=35768 RepID=A0ABZ2RRL5_9BACT|nr:hypothetical protein [Mycoplasmopsis felifaucium]